MTGILFKWLKIKPNEEESDQDDKDDVDKIPF